jgi:hypothetical protein
MIKFLENLAKGLSNVGGRGGVNFPYQLKVDKKEKLKLYMFMVEECVLYIIKNIYIL